MTKYEMFLFLLNCLLARCIFYRFENCYILLDLIPTHQIWTASIISLRNWMPSLSSPFFVWQFNGVVSICYAVAPVRFCFARDESKYRRKESGIFAYYPQWKQWPLCPFIWVWSSLRLQLASVDTWLPWAKSVYTE